MDNEPIDESTITFGIQNRDGVYLPSPAEIRRGCLKIQKTWSRKERETRARGLADRRISSYEPLHVETPTCSTGALPPGTIGK